MDWNLAWNWNNKSSNSGKAPLQFAAEKQQAASWNEDSQHIEGREYV